MSLQVNLIRAGVAKTTISEVSGQTNSWTQIAVKLPPCNIAKNFAIELEIYSPSYDRLFAFDSLRFKNCAPPKVGY